MDAEAPPRSKVAGHQCRKKIGLGAFAGEVAHLRQTTRERQVLIFAAQRTAIFTYFPGHDNADDSPQAAYVAGFMLSTACHFSSAQRNSCCQRQQIDTLRGRQRRDAAIQVSDASRQPPRPAYGDLAAPCRWRPFRQRSATAKRVSGAHHCE